MKRLTLGFLGSMMAASCGGGGAVMDAAMPPDGGPPGSCSITTAGSVSTCIDYTQGYTSATVFEICTGESMAYSSAACPTANVVGQCIVTATDGSAVSVQTWNYYPPEAETDAQASCAALNGMGDLTTIFTGG